MYRLLLAIALLLGGCTAMERISFDPNHDTDYAARQPDRPGPGCGNRCGIP